MDREWLEQKYVAEKLSMATIAKLIGCSMPTVRNHLNKFGISIRSNSESLKGRKLSTEHRIKISQNLAKANEQKHLNSVDEIEKERLASINCSQLWDVGNGRTLCISCHRKTDTYGRPHKSQSTHKDEG